MSTVGYGDAHRGKREYELWHIGRSCEHPSACTYTLSIQTRGPEGPEAPLSAALVSERDGWHATFPVREYPCHTTATEVIRWTQHTSIILRFIDHGDIADANDRDYSYVPRCGYGTAVEDWHATHLHVHVSLELGNEWRRIRERSIEVPEARSASTPAA